MKFRLFNGAILALGVAEYAPQYFHPPVVGGCLVVAFLVGYSFPVFFTDKVHK